MTLDDDLNRLVLTMAPTYEARAAAPSTFGELLMANGATIPVWEGASDGTIYGCPKVNHAFRAWHDACHIAGGFAFDLEGEIAACRYQVQTALERFPRLPVRLQRCIEAEIIGQAQHFAEFGAFPADQFKFFREYVK